MHFSTAYVKSARPKKIKKIKKTIDKIRDIMYDKYISNGY